MYCIDLCEIAAVQPGNLTYRGITFLAGNRSSKKTLMTEMLESAWCACVCACACVKQSADLDDLANDIRKAPSAQPTESPTKNGTHEMKECTTDQHMLLDLDGGD